MDNNNHFENNTSNDTGNLFENNQQYNNPFNQQNIHNSNYIPPQNNYNDSFNRQYADAPKKSSKGIYILLITIIICFAVIICLMFSLMHSMIEIDNKKYDNNNTNLFVSETTLTNNSYIQSTTMTDKKTSVVTTAVQTEKVPEVITVTVIVTEIVKQEPEFQPYTYSINNYNLAIYENAGYDSEVVGHINDKGTYTIVDQYQNWGKLKSGAGWINFEDADSYGNITYAGNGYISTQSDPLSLRYAANPDSKSLASIPRNTSVELYYTDFNDWYYTTYNGHSGFVSAKYITMGNPPEVSVDSYYGYGIIATQKDPLNMHSEPSENSPVLTTIPKGTSVDLYSTSEPDWFYTTYNGKSGFVKSDYISFESVCESYTTLTAVINTKNDPLNLRSSPSTDSSIVTEIPKGTTVTVIDYYSDWCYIQWNDYTGYASTEYLAF